MSYDNFVFALIFFNTLKLEDDENIYKCFLPNSQTKIFVVFWLLLKILNWIKKNMIVIYCILTYLRSL